MWWASVGSIVGVVLGIFMFVVLPFPANAIVAAVFWVASLAVPIALWSKDKTKADAIAVALAAIMSIGTFVGNMTTFGKAFGWIKPIYSIGIEPTAVALNKTAHAKLSAAWRDGGTPPDVSGYRCKWKFSPPLPQTPPDGPCAIDIANTSALFKNSASVALSVSVEAAPPGSKNPVPLDRTRTYTVTMYNHSIPEVELTPAMLEVGNTAAARFAFPEGITPAKYTCSWTPRVHFQNPDACEATFVAPLGTGLYPNGMVPVQVRVKTEGIELPSEEFHVAVHYPPPKLFDYVLDATTNMKATMGGTTLFDRAKANINSQIVRIQPAGGWLAVVGFGQDISGISDDCGRYKPIFSLAPINVANAGKAIESINIAGQLAPLAKAIDTAVKQYSDLRAFYPGKDVEGYFVLLTASTNGCQNMSLADAIGEVETAFRNQGLSVQYYGQTAFTAVIALPAQGANSNAVYSTPTYQGERNHTILLVADNPEDVAKAINAITDLSDPTNRQRGCNDLRELLTQRRDTKGLAILTRQCRG
jgi:hypothetical protein